MLQRDVNYFNLNNSSSSNYVHKLSNDVTAIGSSLSGDLFFGFRGLIFVLAGSSYIIIYGPQLILPSLVKKN